MAERINGDNASDRSDAVTPVNYLSVYVQYEIGSVDDLSSLLPKSAYFLRVL